MREIIKNIKYIEKFDINTINKLDIGIEIQDFTEPNLTDEEKNILIKTYKESLKGFENTIALHGPFLDLKPASPDNLIREVSQKRYIETLEYANELNAEYVIFHSQINPRINKDSLNELINSQTKDAFEYILKESKYQGYIVIENIFEYEPILLLNLVKFI
ncbi:MAG TPA: TIM barrel protein, partial [Tissierellaceae bacterium]